MDAAIETFELMCEFEGATKLRREKIERGGRGILGILGDMGNLANLLKEQGQAKTLYERVIEKQTKALGGEHTETLTTKGNLASLLDKQGSTIAFCSIAPRVSSRGLGLR